MIVYVPYFEVPKFSVLEVLTDLDEVYFYKKGTRLLVAKLPYNYFDVDVHQLFRKRNVQFVTTLGKTQREMNGCINDFQELKFVRWADIHGHTGYSFLDTGISIKDKVRKTDFSSAITDHGNMHGTLEFYKEMHKNNKLPIIGMEAYAETIDGEKKGNHLLLLAKNEEGYKNLSKLTSLSYNNIYRKPHISYEMLAKYGKGIISTTTCMGSEISQLLLRNKYQEAEHVVKTLSSFFEEGDFYVEIQRHGMEEELIVNPQLEKIARNLNMKMVASTDSHYVEKEDSVSHEVLLCIGTKKKMSDDDRMQFPGTNYHIHSEEEIEEIFKDLPEALDNTLEIADKCKDLKLGVNQPFLPKFNYPKEFKDENSYLEHISWLGFEERFKDKLDSNNQPIMESEVYRDRLRFELDVIKGMGFPGYFLIVHDIIDYARKKGILVGPGRGSAAGSLVAYCLKITDLDPIPYDLLFERFLNPDRISMPDIDIDFQDDRRDEVTEYARRTYGFESVCKIATINTLAAKSAIKAVGRVYDIPAQRMGALTKKMPNKVGTTIVEALEVVEFQQEINGNEEYQQIVEHAKKIEKLPRNTSQHACGVVIADGKVRDYIPTFTMKNTKTEVVELTSQYTKDEVEEMGLLKMDFLALRTLRVIDETIRMIKKDFPDFDYDFYSIPYDDPKVYEDISKGQTFGVFQLESGGMRSFMKDLFNDANKFKEPTTELFERLIAGVSLYRPGPMDHIPEYIENLKSPEKIIYDLPELKPILESTYGVIVYQEQTMAIVRELAGFTRGEADNVRKAFAKQDQSLLEGIYEQFMKGTQRNNISADKATIVWDKMKTFASYGFNKSHAAVYSIITARTAWLKKYYLNYFMAAHVNSYIGKLDKLQSTLNHLSDLNIKLLPPSVNHSYEKFSVEGDAIRFGFVGIRSVGKSGESIVAEREENGLFKSNEDFFERMYVNQHMGSSVIEGIIYSGGLDDFLGLRQDKWTMYVEMENYLKKERKNKKDVNINQMSIFDFFEDDSELIESGLKPKFEIVEIKMTKELKMWLAIQEKNYLSMYFSYHPLDDFKLFIENSNDKYVKTKDVNTESNFIEEDLLNDMTEDEIKKMKIELSNESSYEDKVVEMIGVVENCETITTRTGNTMYKFELGDFYGTTEMIVFSNQAAKNTPYLKDGTVVVVKGKISTDDFGTKMIVYEMTSAEEVFVSDTPLKVEIEINSKELGAAIREWVRNNKGSTIVEYIYGGKKYRDENGLDYNLESLSEVEHIINTNKIKSVYSIG